MLRMCGIPPATIAGDSPFQPPPEQTVSTPSVAQNTVSEWLSISNDESVNANIPDLRLKVPEKRKDPRLWGAFSGVGVGIQSVI